MTPDKINTMIPKIHEMKKQRGEWEKAQTVGCVVCCDKLKSYPDGDPDCQHYVNDMKCDHEVKGVNAYLASKLDAITIDAVKAMEAHREGRRTIRVLAGDLKWLRRDYMIKQFNKHVRYTFEDLLASVAIRTMDLMGFYGVEFNIEKCDSINQKSTSDLLRRICRELCHVAETIRLSYVEDCLPGILDRCIRIAELEQIDLEWHIQARNRFEGGE